MKVKIMKNVIIKKLDKKEEKLDKIQNKSLNEEDSGSEPESGIEETFLAEWKFSK